MPVRSCLSYGKGPAARCCACCCAAASRLGVPLSSGTACIGKWLAFQDMSDLGRGPLQGVFVELVCLPCDTLPYPTLPSMFHLAFGKGPVQGAVREVYAALQPFRSFRFETYLVVARFLTDQPQGSHASTLASVARRTRSSCCRSCARSCTSATTATCSCASASSTATSSPGCGAPSGSSPPQRAWYSCHLARMLPVRWLCWSSAAGSPGCSVPPPFRIRARAHNTVDQCALKRLYFCLRHTLYAGACRYRPQANGAGAGEHEDGDAAAYQARAQGGPEQRGGGYLGPRAGGHPPSTSYGQQPAPAAAHYNGSADARGGSAEAKRPLEGQYAGGSAGGRCGMRRIGCGQAFQ